MRLFGWFSKLLLSVILISFLTIFTTAYIVDQYISKFLKQWDVADLEKSTIDVEDYLSKLVNPSQLLDQSETSSADETDIPVFNQSSPDELEQEDSLQQSVPSTNNQSETSTNQPSEPASDSSLTEAPSSSELKDTLVMSAQEFNEKRKKLTNKDKSVIFSIVITKFPQEELQKMSLLLEDGITEEELGDLEDVMNAYLEQEEVVKLLSILNKY